MVKIIEMFLGFITGAFIGFTIISLLRMLFSKVITGIISVLVMFVILVMLIKKLKNGK